MDLRVKELPLIGRVDVEEIERFLRKESISARYKQITENEDFKKAMDSAIETLEDKAKKYELLRKQRRERDSLNSNVDKAFNQLDNEIKEALDVKAFEYAVHINIVLNALSKVLEDIVFREKRTEILVALAMTPELGIMVINGVMKAIDETILDILTENQLRILYEGLEK